MHYRSILAVCAAFAAAAADVDASDFVEGASGDPVSLKSAATVDSLQSDLDQLGHIQRRRAVTRPLVVLVLLGVALATTYLVVQCFKFVASTSSAGAERRRLASGSQGCGEEGDNGSGQRPSVDLILAKMERVKKLKAKEDESREMLLLLQEQLGSLAVRRAMLELEIEKHVALLSASERRKLELQAEARDFDLLQATTSGLTGDGALDGAEETQRAAGGEPVDVSQQTDVPQDGDQAEAAGTATGGEGGSETPSGGTGEGGEGAEGSAGTGWSQDSGAIFSDRQHPEEDQGQRGPEAPEGPYVPGPAELYGQYVGPYLPGPPRFFGPYQGPYIGPPRFVGAYQGPFVGGPVGLYGPHLGYAPRQGPHATGRGGFYGPHQGPAPHATEQGGFEGPHQGPAIGQELHAAGQGGFEGPHQGPAIGQEPHAAGQGGFQGPHQGPAIGQEPHAAGQGGFEGPHQGPAIGQEPHAAGQGGFEGPHQGTRGPGADIREASRRHPSTQQGSGKPKPPKHEPPVPTKESGSSGSGGAKPKTPRPRPSGEAPLAPETPPRPGMSPSMSRIVGRFERAARLGGAAPMTAKDKAYLERKQQQAMLGKTMQIRKEVDQMREEAVSRGTYTQDKPPRGPTPEERYRRRKEKILSSREKGDFGSDDDE